MQLSRRLAWWVCGVTLPILSIAGGVDARGIEGTFFVCSPKVAGSGEMGAFKDAEDREDVRVYVDKAGNVYVPSERCGRRAGSTSGSVSKLNGGVNEMNVDCGLQQNSFSQEAKFDGEKLEVDSRALLRGRGRRGRGEFENRIHAVIALTGAGAQLVAYERSYERRGGRRAGSARITLTAPSVCRMSSRPNF